MEAASASPILHPPCLQENGSVEGNPFYCLCCLRTMCFCKALCAQTAAEQIWLWIWHWKKHGKNMVSFCKFKSVLIYIRIAKPFVLPLQIFATITNKITFSQNCSENRRLWASLADPGVAYSSRKTYGFPYVNWKVYWFTHRIAKPLYLPLQFFLCIKQYTFSKNSNETRRIWGILAAPDFANSGKKT